MEQDQITEQLLRAQFELPSSESRAELEKLLSEHLVYLMLHRMEFLLSILYRIDVAESKCKAAFAQNDPKRIAPELARYILERLDQKAISRIQNRHKTD